MTVIVGLEVVQGLEVLMRKTKTLTCVQGHHHPREKAVRVPVLDLLHAHVHVHEHHRRMDVKELRKTEFGYEPLKIIHKNILWVNILLQSAQ